MKISKKFLIPLSLIGLWFNNAWAADASFEFTVTPITENVYSIISPSYGRPSPENKGWNSNSHFVVTNKGVLVFDTGSSELIGSKIIDAIKSVTNQPIRWVVNSHSHADHWLGNAAFANAGTEILATASSIKTMKKNGVEDVEAFSRMTKGATGSTNIIYPTSSLVQREKRSFGGVDVEFIFSNDGHSSGDILMWLPQQKIIFGGDVISSDWMPIMTPSGNVPNLIKTLNSVAKLNPTTVLAGHGKVTTINSILRDAEFLSSAWKLTENGKDNEMKFADILSLVVSQLGPKYEEQYKDFDSTIEYLVQMMYKKQK